MREADWEQLFLQYLRKRRLTEVERVFTRHIAAEQPEDNDMSLQQQLDVRRGVIESLAHFSTEKDPNAYTDAYEKFATWVDNSLDLYRPELRKLLHPVFVYSYVQLVEADATVAACKLLERYSIRCKNTQGGFRRRQAQDVKELKSVTSKHHLVSNRFVAAMLSGGKQQVKLSTYSYELLMHYLHNSGLRMLPLLSIINMYFDFKVLDGPPKAMATAAAAEEAADDDDDWDGGLPTDPALASTNAQPLELGLLKDNVEDLYVQRQQQQQQQAGGSGDAAADGAAAGTDGKDGAGKDGKGAGEEPASKKQKKGDGKTGAAATPAKSKQQPVVEERIPLPPWLPELAADVQEQAVTDIGVRAQVGAQLLPSCCFYTFANAKQSLTCAAFSLDGSKVVGGLADSTVRLYDMRAIAEHHATQRRLRQRHAAATAATLDSPSGLYNSSHMSPAATLSDPSLDPNWDPDDLSVNAAVLCGHTAAVHAVDFSADQRTLLSASSDGTLRLWSSEFLACLVVYAGHVFPVWDVAACPQGLYFASASADRTARVWATDRTQPLRLLAGHQADVDVVKWHPNCHYVASASSDRTVRLWDMRDGGCARYLPGLSAAPTSLAFSPDGRTLAAGAEDGSVCVWDLASARRLASAPPAACHAGPVWSMAYSQGSGALLVTGGADETVKVWKNDLAGVSKDGVADAVSALSRSLPGRRPDYYPLLKTYATKSSPVVGLQFTPANLLLGVGPFHKRTAPNPTPAPQQTQQ